MEIKAFREKEAKDIVCVRVYPKLCVKSEERRKTEQKIIYLGRAVFPASLFCSISGNRVHVKGGGLSRRGIYP